MHFPKDNVFWVPESARWETLRSQAKQTDLGAIIDRAMGDIESENNKGTLVTIELPVFKKELAKFL